MSYPDAIYELGTDTLKEIEQSDASETVKVLNLQKALRRKVVDESKSKPFLISIGDRAEAIAEAYENRQVVTQNTLAEFMRLAEECVLAAREQEQMRLNDNSFAVYTVLRNTISDVTPEQARAVNQVFEQFPDYQWNEEQKRDLRTTLYSTLEPSVDIKAKIEITNKLLELERV